LVIASVATTRSSDFDSNTAHQNYSSPIQQNRIASFATTRSNKILYKGTDLFFYKTSAKPTQTRHFEYSSPSEGEDQEKTSAKPPDPSLFFRAPCSHSAAMLRATYSKCLV
jgi:hypothetical protein